MSKKLFRTLGALAVSIVTLYSGVAAAQIDEIIVTANKREQTLQDIPVSVSVTSAQQIEQSAIVDLIDLQSAVPTLRVGQLQKQRKQILLFVVSVMVLTTQVSNLQLAFTSMVLLAVVLQALCLIYQPLSEWKY